MVGPGKIFKIEILRQLENAIMHLVFANNRTILLIFKAEFTETVLDILLYLESNIRPKKFFKIKVLSRLKTLLSDWFL